MSSIFIQSHLSQIKSIIIVKSSPCEPLLTYLKSCIQIFSPFFRQVFLGNTGSENFFPPISPFLEVLPLPSASTSSPGQTFFIHRGVTFVAVKKQYYPCVKSRRNTNCLLKRWKNLIHLRIAFFGKKTFIHGFR